VMADEVTSRAHWFTLLPQLVPAAPINFHDICEAEIVKPTLDEPSPIRYVPQGKKIVPPEGGNLLIAVWIATVSSVEPLAVAPYILTSIQGEGPLIWKLAGAVAVPILPSEVEDCVKIEATVPEGVPHVGVPFAEMPVAYWPEAQPVGAAANCVAVAALPLVGAEIDAGLAPVSFRFWRAAVTFATSPRLLADCSAPIMS